MQTSLADVYKRQRLILAFQPHTYTRTAALFDDFVEVLRLPDCVVLAEIYAAREKNDIGISNKVEPFFVGGYFLFPEINPLYPRRDRG